MLPHIMILEHNMHSGTLMGARCDYICKESALARFERAMCARTARLPANARPAAAPALLHCLPHTAYSLLSSTARAGSLDRFGG